MAHEEEDADNEEEEDDFMEIESYDDSGPYKS